MILGDLNINSRNRGEEYINMLNLFDRSFYKTIDHVEQKIEDAVTFGTTYVNG